MVWVLHHNENPVPLHMTESQLPWSSSEGLNQKQVMNHHSFIFTIPSAHLGSVNSLASTVWVPSEFSVCLSFCISWDEISSPFPLAQKGLSVNPPNTQLGITVIHQWGSQLQISQMLLNMEAGKGIQMHLDASGEHWKAPTPGRRKQRDGRSGRQSGGREPRLWLRLLEVMGSHYWFLRLGAPHLVHAVAREF